MMLLAEVSSHHLQCDLTHDSISWGGTYQTFSQSNVTYFADIVLRVHSLPPFPTRLPPFKLPAEINSGAHLFGPWPEVQSEPRGDLSPVPHPGPLRTTLLL